MNYYNEFDKFPAEWLRGLMSGGEIPQGDVDERSITDVQATDLLGYRQCHFFAGIGGWARALRLAGIADDANVDTASLPCQPFSTAGLQKGEQDERHLWPVYFGLFQQRRPELAFGEQVSAAIRVGWIDRVQADLEAAGYSFGFVVLGAHSVGAPHIRQRIYWGAKRRSVGLRDANSYGCSEGWIAATANGYRNPTNATGGGLSDSENHGTPEDIRTGRVESNAGRAGSSGMANTDQPIFCGQPSAGQQPEHERDRRNAVGLSNTSGGGRRPQGHEEQQPAGTDWDGAWSCHTAGYYRDGKTRRIGCGIQPLAYGVPRDLGRTRSILEGMGHGPKEVKRMLRRPRSLLAMAGRNRVGRLKGYGNAIVPQVAAMFIRAFMECQS